MASLTSTQSGNWSSSSTWGGSTPADGDTFTIAAGHIVTVNSDVRTTNGTGDINCDGKLLMTSGAYIRVNGVLRVRASSKTSFFSEGVSTSGGMFEMQNGTDLELVGVDANNHGIWVENHAYVSIIMQGSEKNLNTTLSSEHNYQQDYLDVADASNFSQGDWITVFKRDTDYRLNADEGFFVHDTDTANNRIYVRHFVSPTAEITSVSGSTITVDNAKVFRKGYKIIFGTGTNRNVKTISSIKRNNITLDSAVDNSPSVAGLTVYQTGNEKKLINGSLVKRMATTLTTAVTSTNSTNQITVGDASDISVGDRIFIDVNNDSDTNWNYQADYTVSSKSGNTLTLTGNVARTHKVGSIVTIASRDCYVHTNGNSDQRVFLLVERRTDTDAFRRRVRIQNVHFKGLGRNDNSTYYAGVCIAGRASRLNTAGSSDYDDFESRVDSCVYDSPTNRSSYSSIYFRDNNVMLYRNNVSYNNERGYWGYSGNYSVRFFNNYATRTTYTCFITDGWYDTSAHFQYFYGTRADDYGIIFNHLREQQNPMRHVILLNHENRCFYSFYRSTGQVVVGERILADGYRHGFYIGASGGDAIFLDSKTTNRWDGTAESGTGTVYSNYVIGGNSDSRCDYDRTTGKTGYGVFIDENFEKDRITQYIGAIRRTWNAIGKYWDVTIGSDGTNNGFFENVFVPAGTTVRVSCEVQCSSSGSFTRPTLMAKTHRGGHYRGRFETDYSGQTSVKNSTNTKDFFAPNLGFQESVQYSSSSDGAWEEKQITIQPQKLPYFLITGVYAGNLNIREEGFKMKDINVNLSNASGLPALEANVGQRRSQVRSAFNSSKKRISGRI